MAILPYGFNRINKSMSIDNGIYVLETGGPEFRIVYAHAIDNIYGTFDSNSGKWSGDMNRMIDYFGQSVQYNSLDEAMIAAKVLSKQYIELEDGIAIIRNFKEMKFGVM